MTKKLIYGHGINDYAGKVTHVVNGKRVTNVFYRTWHSMIKRCYDPIEHKNYPTYKGCCVVEEWHSFTNFMEWMETQNYENMQLNKDLLIPDNKLYSPETCVFIHSKINAFLTNRTLDRSEHGLGVSKNKGSTRYRAACNDPEGGRISIGMFDTKEEAHLAWKAKKNELAFELAKTIDDERIANALRNYFKRDFK